MVSPWVEPGSVYNEEYRHTSLIATLRKTWDLGDPLTQRDAQARTFDHVFTRSTPAIPTPGSPSRPTPPRLGAGLRHSRQSPQPPRQGRRPGPDRESTQHWGSHCHHSSTTPTRNSHRNSSSKSSGTSPGTSSPNSRPRQPTPAEPGRRGCARTREAAEVGAAASVVPRRWLLCRLGIHTPGPGIRVSGSGDPLMPVR